MDAMGLPMGFGKKAVNRNPNVQSRLDKTKRTDDVAGPSSMPPPSSIAGAKRPLETTIPDPSSAGPSNPPANAPFSDSASDSSFDHSDDEDEGGASTNPSSTHLTSSTGTEFPISHELLLKDHTKPLTAFAFDSAGARIATGGYDYDVKLWDFGGMDGRLRSFKGWEPAGSYHVHDLSFSPDNQHLLVVSGTTQPKMYTREGEDGVSFNKGDVYLRDMRHTNGHTADLTAGSWHPRNSDEFITSGNDSTIRIWNPEERKKQKTVIVVKSKERGARTKVTACAWGWDGKTIGVACEDGTFHLWDTKSNMSRPSLSNETAHVKGTETSGIVFSRDGRQVGTRGGDDTVKLWDMRSLRKPLYIASALPNAYPETNLIFSPDEKFLLTGLAVEKGKGQGEVVVLGREGLEENRRIRIGEGSVIKVGWQSKINQIFATTSLGACHVLYSPSLSIHGALLPLSKMPKTAPREQTFTAVLPPVIMTPHALPAFKDEDYNQSKRKKEKERMDPVKSHKPQAPVEGRGKGGRVGASATQHLVQSLFKDTTREEDPREALLKYADKGDGDAIWTGAWKQNQPNAVFRETYDEEESEKQKKKQKRN